MFSMAHMQTLATIFILCHSRGFEAGRAQTDMEANYGCAQKHDNQPTSLGTEYRTEIYLPSYLKIYSW